MSAPYLPSYRRRFRPTVIGWFWISYLLLLALICWSLFAPAEASVPREAYSYRLRILREAQAVWGVAAPSATFAAQIAQESAYRPEARSGAGAQGLAQFMPATATWIAGAYAALGPAAPFNPSWAVRALVRYDRHLWERLSAANRCERMAFTLSAYNGGAGWVQRRKRLSPAPGVCLGATCDINPGIKAANQRENARYPARILRALEPQYIAAGFGRGACA